MLVSLAVAETEERAIDSIRVMLLCIGVLANDGQFARLALLAERLQGHGRALESERPFLSTALQAFALALRGNNVRASQSLSEVLGFGEVVPQRRAPSNSDQLGDLLAATTLRALLTKSDTAFATRARNALLNAGDGTALAFVDAVLSWQHASSNANPSVVLQKADSTFTQPDLRRYLARRRIPVLYPPQIMAIDGGATRDGNCVVSLPTSSGKTLIAEYRIAAALSRHPGSTAIYVAPYRLLARQVERDFRQYLSKELNYAVRDLGMGFETTPVNTDEFDVVISTPERLDALFRVRNTTSPGHEQAANLFNSCSILVFDELQLLGRAGRGQRFELLLSRIRAAYPELSVLGLSAAAQGTEELAEWLDTPGPIAGASRPTGTLEILWESSGRLLQRVNRRPPTPVAQMDRSKNASDDAVRLILHLNTSYRPVLTVCTNRTNAESIAKKLVRQNPQAGSQWRDSLGPREATALADAIEETRSLLGEDHPLAACMERGVAFHHAGVPTPVLQQIERLAKRRLLRAVCATTTVAEGADLPFRVVVIPHLTFAGRSGRLERDLYLNIVGRAGRANVSVEGIVFILDSDARTLKNHVRGNLWSITARDRVRGQVNLTTSQPTDVDSWREYQEVKSQVMGWLGDGDSYVDGQAQRLAEQTFSYQSGDRRDQRAVVGVIADALSDLEQEGYAFAASPFQLTERGARARLTGLSGSTVKRLEQSVERGRNGWLLDLLGVDELSLEACSQISSFVFDSVEVFEHSLWLRRTVKSSAEARYQAIMTFADDGDEHLTSEDFAADLDLFSSWISGYSYIDLARLAPTYPHAGSLFGGTAEDKRTSDATEYIGKLTYPAKWVWSAVHVLAEGIGPSLPNFIGSAIEYGVPSEAATRLIQQGFLTRPAALAITAQTGPSWAATRDWVQNAELVNDPIEGLTRLDHDRLLDLRDRLVQEDARG
jgi:hypothetical protein